MTPKEKAKELVDKFTNLYEGINLGLAKKHWAKQSALIAVDDILRVAFYANDEIYNHYLKVKQELEKL
jgi:hypothetical protein